ncbi:MAG TPA: hypothetical protein VJ761_01555 [Ktedonobacteraceae bacterium]|nr:hypothetical protein [Ktedonobacteraceae bacterium]
MQTPQLPRSFLNGRVGYVVALAGSAISLFSFCAIPFGYTCFFVFCSSLSFWQQLVQDNVLSWVLLVVIIITCIVALIGTLLTSSPALAISLIVFGLIGTGLFLWTITRVATIPNTSIAIGIWLCFFGMIVAAIGGVAAITGSRPLHPLNSH